ncbi:MAG: hypothetical protein KTR30_17360 [Saprospiraceae bacterium]|nr:hypothetical protein [Saprospiraceae bacterium]
MNYYLFSAGILTILLGLAHSILGETLIFKYKRQKGQIIPTKQSKALPEGHLRIIWATWHVASILAWGIGATLIYLASLPAQEAPWSTFFITASSYSILAVGTCVLWATKGKHPGWIVAAIIVLLLFLR